MTKHVERVAHRGGSHLAPENTLAAFRNALTLPIDTIELDVHMSRDGEAVVFHDDSVEKCTNGRGNVLDLDFAYLRGLDAAAHFPGGWPEPQQIPTLREVLNVAKGHVRVCIEIKQRKRDGVYGRYSKIAETVVAQVCDAAMVDEVLIISFDWMILPLVKMLEPRLQVGALVSKEMWCSGDLDILMSEVTTLGCDWVSVDRSLFTGDLLTAMHERGFKVGVWTVNTVDELRCLAAAGVDALTSDRPDLFAGM